MRAGFRALVRQPSLVLGEIAWRWAFGLAAWTLVLVAARRILNQVDLTPVELLLARQSDLLQIADACARILVQVLPQLGRECLVLVPAMTILWIAAATLGRAVTLQALLSSPVHAHFGQLTALNLLRAVFTLATFVALLGALFFVGTIIPAQNLPAAAAMSVVVAVLVAFFWSIVNWFLALAPLWIVRDGRPALRAIGDSIHLLQRSPQPYLGVASWFAFIRAVALLAAVFAAVIAAQAPPAAAIALEIVIALVYFAVADFLYIARLAAYLNFDQMYPVALAGAQPVAPAGASEQSTSAG